MRRLFAVLALPLLLLGLTAAHKATDRDGEDLLGPVRTVTSQITRYSPEETEKQGLTQQRDLVSYDPEGNETERTIYDDFGFLGGRNVHKRDSSGHLVESILSDPKGKVMARQVYTYSDGRLTETVHYDGKGEAGLREVNSYDENGRLSETTYYEGTKAAAKTIYRYDGAGRGSETAFFMADGSRAVAPIGPCLGAHRMTYTYDGKGRSHKVVSYEPDGSLKKSWLYAYNDRGLMSEETLEDDHDQTIRIHSYEYDSRGNWIKRSTIETMQIKPGPLGVGGNTGFEAELMKPLEMRITISRKISYH